MFRMLVLFSVANCRLSMGRFWIAFYNNVCTSSSGFCVFYGHFCLSFYCSALLNFMKDDFWVICIPRVLCTGTLVFEGILV